MVIDNGMKARKRAGHAAFLGMAIVLCVITSFLGVGSTKLLSSVFFSQKHLEANAQAQEYAVSLAEVIRSTDYDKISAQERGKLSQSNYESSISVEENKNDGLVKKNIVIKVFWNKENTPRADLKLSRFKYKNGGFPIGTIMIWPCVGNIPADDGVWLTCNGQEIPSKYTQLIKVLNGRTVLPNMENKTLRGYGCSYQDETDGGWIYQSGELLEVQENAQQEINPEENYFYNYVPEFVANGGSTNGSRRDFNLESYNMLPNGYFGSDLTNLEMIKTGFDNPSKKKGLYRTMGLKVALDAASVTNVDFVKEELDFRPNSFAVSYVIKAL